MKADELLNALNEDGQRAILACCSWTVADPAKSFLLIYRNEPLPVRFELLKRLRTLTADKKYRVIAQEDERGITKIDFLAAIAQGLIKR